MVELGERCEKEVKVLKYRHSSNIFEIRLIRDFHPRQVLVPNFSPAFAHYYVCQSVLNTQALSHYSSICSLSLNNPVVW